MAAELQVKVEEPFRKHKGYLPCVDVEGRYHLFGGGYEDFPPFGRNCEQRVLFAVDIVRDFSPKRMTVECRPEADQILQIDDVVVRLLIVRAQGEFQTDKFRGPFLRVEIRECNECAAAAASLEFLDKRGTASASIDAKSGSLLSNSSGKVSYRLIISSPSRPNGLDTLPTVSSVFIVLLGGGSFPFGRSLRFLGLCGGSGCCFSPFGLDSLRLLFVGFFLRCEACLFGLLLFAGQLLRLGGYLGGLLAHPFFELGIGCGFVESSFGNASEEVLLVHHTLVGEDGAAGVRGLCTLLEPFQGFVEIQVDGSRIRVRIVGTNLFDELAIAWRPAVCDNDMIKGVAFLTVARKSDFTGICLNVLD